MVTRLTWIAACQGGDALFPLRVGQPNGLAVVRGETGVFVHVHVSVFSWKYCKQRYWFLYADSLYQFDIVLIGPVRQQLPLIAYAFGQAFKRGITKNNTMGTLEDIAVEKQRLLAIR